MPRYYFDIDDGKRQVHDVIGMDLSSADRAMVEASTLLRTLAEIRQIEGRPGTTIVTVRDCDDEKIYEGSAHLEG